MADEHLRLKKILEIKLTPPPSGEFLEALAEAAWNELVGDMDYHPQSYKQLDESTKASLRSAALRVVKRYREGDSKTDG